MSTWVDLQDETMELIYQISARLKVTNAAAVDVAVAMLAAKLRLKVVAPQE